MRLLGFNITSYFVEKNLPSDENKQKLLKKLFTRFEQLKCPNKHQNSTQNKLVL